MEGYFRYLDGNDGGYDLEIWIPNTGPNMEARILYRQDGELKHADTIRLEYEPRFGVDAGDMQNINERIDKTLEELNAS